MNSDPISWIFFVVAGIGGRRQPLAAVSWTGVGEDGSVPGGWSVLSCCCRLLAAFRDPANRRALRAELALAHDFHLNEAAAAAAGPGRKVAELRECNRSPSWDDRFNDWDTVSTARFPFIASCAFQTVASDPFDTNPRHAFVEPICTVYRDTSIEWGMAVIDITDLHDPAYGLVAFPVVPMKFTPDHAAAVRAVSADPHPWYETQGELRVMYEDRPRQPLSAVDYIARFDDEQERWSASYMRESVLDALSRVPLADAMSTELIWPPRPQDDASLAISSASAWKKQRDSISVLIQESLSKGLFDPSIFEEYKRETGFLETLRQSILLNSARLDLPDGLIEFSFLDGSHLSLEQFPRLSPDTIFRLLQVPSMARVESISLCLDSIDGSPPRLVDALSQTTKLQRVYLMQKPRNPRVALSAETFMAMMATPGFLSKIEVFMAGPHSSSLCKKQWLLESTIPAHLQLVLFETFPMQQILVKGCKNFWSGDSACIYLGDMFLKPGRFISGFLNATQCILMNEHSGLQAYPPYLFSLSCAPNKIAGDAFTEAEVTYMANETFCKFPDAPEPRYLVKEAWTVVIQVRSNIVSITNSEQKRTCTINRIAYAFVRAVRDPVQISSCDPTELGDLQVCGIQEFLQSVGLEVIWADVHGRLVKMAETVNSYSPLKLSLEERFSLMSHSEVTSSMLDIMKEISSSNS